MFAPMKAVASDGVTVPDIMRDIDRGLLRQNLKLTPEELRQRLQVANKTATDPPPQKVSGQEVAA